MLKWTLICFFYVFAGTIKNVYFLMLGFWTITLEDDMSQLLKKAFSVVVASAIGVSLFSMATYSSNIYAAPKSSASAQTQASLSPAAKELRRRLDSITSFSAKFVQDVSDPDGSSLNESRGMLYLKRPSSFMMHTTEPDELALYTKKDGIYYYDAALNQLSIYDLSNLVASPFVLLLKNDDGTFLKYDIRQDGDRFTLIPLKSEEIESITISFDAKTTKVDGKDVYSLESITIRMDDGNNNFYRFSNQSAKVSDKNFDFTIPKDAEIDDER